MNKIWLLLLVSWVMGNLNPAPAAEESKNIRCTDQQCTVTTCKNGKCTTTKHKNIEDLLENLDSTPSQTKGKEQKKLIIRKCKDGVCTTTKFP